MDVVREFLNGAVRLHVLHHAAHGEVYGAWMRAELERHGYNISQGTLYPLLHRMQVAGLLTSRRVFVDGHERRMYLATGRGRAALAACRSTLRELVGEVMPRGGASEPDAAPEPVHVRYVVKDVDAATEFYNTFLGFTVEANPTPGFAVLARGELRLLLSAPTGSGGAAQAMPDGRMPEPGGWNRLQLRVEDLDAAVVTLRGAGVPLRSEVVTGRGGRQVLVDDPSGNPVELFEPAQSG